MLIFYFVVAILIYFKVLFNVDFLYDDYEYIVNNPILNSLTQVLTLNDPRQVAYISFYINYFLGGLNTFGFHLVNISIHAINAWLIYSILKRVSKVEIATFTSILFLVHPINTQAVSYISQRFTSLATLFYLLTIYLYIRARTENKENIYWLALVTTFLAMRTKEIAWTLPFMIVFIEHVFISSKKKLIYYLPFLMMLLVIPIILFTQSTNDNIAEVTRQEKIYDLTTRSSYEYFLTQLTIIPKYLQTIIYPINQYVIFDIKASREINVVVVRSFLILMLLLLVSFMSKNKGVMIGICWFFVTASIESSFIPIKDLAFEHRMYLPSIGLFFAFSSFVSEYKWAYTEFAIYVLCLFLAITAYERNNVWTSDLALWDNVVKTVPTKAIGYNNRGAAYLRTGKYELAIEDFTKTITFFNNGPHTWETTDLIPKNMFKTYISRGQAYQALGKKDLADADFKRAEAIINAKK